MGETTNSSPGLTLPGVVAMMTAEVDPSTHETVTSPMGGTEPVQLASISWLLSLLSHEAGM